VYLEGTATIAGSTITMADAVQHAVRDAGVPLELVSRAASMVPAHLLGLDRETGSIEVGKLADLVVLDEALVPVAVAVVGAWQAVAADGITLASDVSVGEARA
jgi:N-acetylglucosamine-6-phosphate deacetylase